jgi:hypothetical protein
MLWLDTVFPMRIGFKRALSRYNGGEAFPSWRKGLGFPQDTALD